MKKFKVEAFIIPSHNKTETESNQIDDVKIAKKLQDQSFTSLDELKLQNSDEEKDNKQSCDEKIEEEQNSSEFSELFFAINEHIYDEIIVSDNKEKKETKQEQPEYTKALFQIEEPIYDEPFVGNLTKVNSKKNNNNNYDVPPNRYPSYNSKHRYFGVHVPKLPKRSTSLKSIVEDIECVDETLQDICCHGRKNGCLFNSEPPENISDEIFKENWIKKLDSLRKLETLLKDKEVALQSRERLLFKKEKELRILERLVKDKMRQAELYAKRYKKSSSSESIVNNERNLEFRCNSSKSNTKSENIMNPLTSVLKVRSKESLESKDEFSLKNPFNSRTSLTTERLSRVGSVRTRSRPRHKMRFDDLDSTLSADIGDSSFVVTSKKFDPQAFKKPAAFLRSASERRPRLETQIDSFNKNIQKETTNEFADVREEHMFKKISENILASQNEDTKFLNYGLIDEKALADIKPLEKETINQKRFSYLNLEFVNKAAKLKNVSKERPISWSEDTDDWLQKKRQAYNLATKNVLTGVVAEKENIVKQEKADKSVKMTKKKEHNRKRFSLFR